MDFAAATKISGARFVTLQGQGEEGEEGGRVEKRGEAETGGLGKGGTKTRMRMRWGGERKAWGWGELVT
eukprot:616326-Hanusia_phi.AAC.1